MANSEFKDTLIRLLQEEHSHARTSMVADLIRGDADRFAVAWEVFCTAEPPVPQRMAWVMNVLTDRYPAHAARYATTIAARLPYFGHPAELRAATRMLSKIVLPAEAIGDLLTFLFPVLEDPNVPVAIRVHAMEILYKISDIEPEIKQELALVIEMQMQFASPGFISRAKKILPKLRKQLLRS